VPLPFSRHAGFRLHQTTSAPTAAGQAQDRLFQARCRIEQCIIDRERHQTQATVIRARLARLARLRLSRYD
jgi:hypothetical protein